MIFFHCVVDVEFAGRNCYWIYIVWFFFYEPIDIWFMGWLSRIFKGSEHRVSEGHYYKDDSGYYLPSTSGVMKWLMQFLMLWILENVCFLCFDRGLNVGCLDWEWEWRYGSRYCVVVVACRRKSQSEKCKWWVRLDS